MKAEMRYLLLTTTILQLSFILPASSQTTINFLSLVSSDSQNAFSITRSNYSMLTVYGIGDINGDGISDLIVTQAFNQVYVLYGSPDRFGQFVVPSWNSYTSIHGFRIYLDLSYDLMYISSFGDFNNDGINDMVFQIRPRVASTQIEALMIYGKKDRDYNDLILESNLAITDGFRIYTPQQYELLVTNYSVIRTGDINNDGMDDAVIVRQPEVSWWDTERGRIYALYGNAQISDDIVLANLPSSSKFRIYDQDPERILLIDWIGDINHDGVDDFAARSSTNGDLYVIYGRAGGLSEMNVVNISNSQGFRIMGSDPYYRPSYYFKHAGDLNGDGITDLVIGAEGNSVFKPVYIIYGKASDFSDIVLENITSSDGFKIVESTGKETLGSLSSHIEDIGDINNDGFDDIIIVSTDKTTKLNKGYIIFGQKDRRPNIDVTFAENILTIGFNTMNYFFVPIKKGDLNGDGIDDLAIKTYYTLFGLYGSNCEEYNVCLSPVPTICYASKGCGCRKKNMIMQDLSCVSSCSPGYYQAPDITCKVCSVTCKSCSSNPFCETCFDGYILQDSLCVSSCSDGYIQIGSICQSNKVIFGATAGAVTALVLVIIAIVYIKRRRKHATASNNTISFPDVRFETEIEMKLSISPSHFAKDSYLEYPIDRVQDDNDPHPAVAVIEEENQNNNEGERVNIDDQKQAEYEVQAKRASMQS